MPCGRGTIARVAVLFLALYIVVDFATPLLPGAFRFDVSQSIEVGGRAGVRLAVVVDADAPSSPARVVRQAPSPALGLMRRQRGTPSRVSDVPRPARTDSPSDTIDDD